MGNILEEIFVGWKNLVFEDADVEAEARKRIEICVDCNHFNKVRKSCEKCGCYMPAKTRSPRSGCPIGKWSPMKKG